MNKIHEVRHVRMNQPHPAKLTPSWYGDSVGHYEGDTLVVDTVGQKSGPFAMLDLYGTPYTKALHVVERYRLLDYEAAKKLERDKERINGGAGEASTATIGVSTYRSHSRSKMKASSRCPGPRL